MPAEVEEIVLRTDPRYVQHLREQPAEDLFLRCARPAGRGARGGLRRGQRLAVQLAVRGQGQFVQHDERGRHHVLRERVGHVPTQRRGVEGRAADGRDDVGGQTLVARAVLADDHTGVTDLRMGCQDGPDLAQLDPEATDLHLVIGTAQVFQCTVGAPPGDIARAVHPGARRAERIGDEALRRQCEPVQVALGQTRTRHVHFPGHPGGRRPQRSVEHVDPQVGDAPADQAARSRRRLLPVQADVADVDRGLGDAVHVDQRGRVLRVPGVPLGQPPQIQRLAAEDHVAQCQTGTRLQVVGVGLDELVERRRRLVQHGDPLAGQELEELPRRPGHVVRHDDEPAAVQQRSPQLPHREVEGRRVEQRPHVVGAEVEPRPGGPEQPHDIVVRYQYALGTPCRPRRVDDVGRALRAERRQPLGVGEVLRGVAGQARDRTGRVQPDPPGGGADVGPEVLGGEHEEGARVVEHERDPVGGIAGVHRHVGGAGLHHREQCDDEVRGTGQGDRDEPSRPGPFVDQEPGQPVRPRVELPVRQLLAVVGNRACLRVGARPRLEELGEGRRSARSGIAVPVLEHAPALVGRREFQRGHVLVRLRLGEVPDETDESPGVGAEVVGGVQQWTGGDVDPGPALAGPGVDHHHEVVVVAAGQRPHDRAVATPLQVVVEEDDVDARAQDPPAVRHRAQRTPQVLIAVALVRQDEAHLLGDLPQQRGDRVPRPHRHPERNHVGHHSGDRAGAAGRACGHGHREDDVLLSGHGVEVDGLGRDERGRPGDPGFAAEVAQPGHDGLVQDLAGPQHLVGHALGQRRQAGYLGLTGKVLQPELLVLRALFGRLVLQVLGDELGERPADGHGRRALLGEGRIHLRQALGHEPDAHSVGDEVVEAAVPGEVIVREPEQGEGAEFVTREIDRLLQVRPCPGLDRRVRIGFGAHVEHVQRQVRQREHVLVGALTVVAEADPQGIGLGDDLLERSLERLDVDGTLDVDPLGEAEDRAFRSQLLREPDSGLAGRQR